MRSSSRATLVLFSAAAIGCLAALSPVRAAEPDGLAALIGPAEALRIAIVTRASEKGAKGGAEMKAVADYYSDSDATLLWVDDNGLNSRAKSVMEEIGKADEYGLRASDYTLPKLDSFDRNAPNATAALADAEIKLNIAVLRYARDARGGRFDWSKISRQSRSDAGAARSAASDGVHGHPLGSRRLFAQLPARPASVPSLAQGADRRARRQCRRKKR